MDVQLKAREDAIVDEDPLALVDSDEDEPAEKGSQENTPGDEPLQRQTLHSAGSQGDGESIFSRPPAVTNSLLTTRDNFEKDIIRIISKEGSKQKDAYVKLVNTNAQERHGNGKGNKHSNNSKTNRRNKRKAIQQSNDDKALVSDIGKVLKDI
eukprot:Nk52_evm28s1705 gene=Nk52_evmTU28s1705